MRMNKPVDVAVVARRNLRHMAIGAVHGRLRIVERARALARNTAGLPVVVFIEAANPAVVIYGNIQMHFVARRAEFRRVHAHERLQEGAAVRLRIKANQKIVERTDHGIVTRCEFMQLRILQEKVALAHRAFHLHDAVAH